VEDKETAGCDTIQGYYFSKPVPGDLVPATVLALESGAVMTAVA
jgi:EAL domain-containing protein (putative c-di-GMP-specific phosphodiesterase class I)